MRKSARKMKKDVRCEGIMDSGVNAGTSLRKRFRCDGFEDDEKNNGRKRKGGRWSKTMVWIENVTDLLPCEIWRTIFLLLGFDDAVICTLVCRGFQAMIENGEFWIDAVLERTENRYRNRERFRRCDAGQDVGGAIDAKKEFYSWCRTWRWVTKRRDALGRRRVGCEEDVRDGVGNRRMLKAAEMGYVSVCAFLLDNGMDIGFRDKQGRDAFRYALDGGRVDVCDMLIARGMNVDTKDESNQSHLSAAIKRRDIRLCRMLLDRGASMVNVYCNGVTALHVATDDMNIFKMLLECGAEFDAVDYVKQTVIHSAIDTIRYFFDRNYDRDEHDRQVLLMCSLLLAHVETLSLGMAARSESVHGLVAEDVVSCTKRWTKFIKKKDYKGRDALYYASEKGLFSVCRFLIEHGAFANGRTGTRETALHAASTSNNHQVCVFLLENGAELEARDYINQTPLHYAIKNCDLKTTRVLLDRGADLGARSTGHNGVLHFAVKYCGLNTECVHRDNYHGTLYNQTLKANAIALCRLLIERGADIDGVNEEGKTPLHLAIDGVERIARKMYSKYRKRKKNGSPRRGGSTWDFIMSSDDSYHGSIMSYALKLQCRISVCRFLVQSGAKIGTHDIFGNTPLRQAQKIKGNTIRDTILDILSFSVLHK